MTVFALLMLSTGGWPEHVTVVKSKKGEIVQIDGRLEKGEPMEDLSWASKSSTACFPATQNAKFRGNHVLYATTLPPRSKMKITVTPEDESADLSIYAYSIGTTNFRVVPSLTSCVSCEAEHKWDRPKRGRTQTSARSVELNAIRNPYNVVIGVTGPASATSGKFTLEIVVE